jgi:hypothetical protein
MDLEFDPRKSEVNVQNRGLSFSLVAEFDFETALFAIDDRHDYGESRFRALGFIGSRIHAMVFSETATGIRVISLRKANKREIQKYGQQKT